jgi:glutamate-1-semialdehyde 2,1-aminomutase
MGYHHPEIEGAVCEAIRSGPDLFGSGPTELEGKLAELVCTNSHWIERFVVFCSGSEATQQAIRLARAATGRDHVIVMQGGYNGWHNDVACNLMTPLSQLGPRRSPGEYDFLPISAGIPEAHRKLIHPINFNDLDSVRYVCERYDVAGILLEPVLQNVGIIKPEAGYLEGLRKLAGEFGFLLMFDEVKTGFRHAFGGFAEISGVTPDLAIYGKAISSGYPLGAIGGKAKWLDFFHHPEPGRRVLLAGTYNGHHVPLTAALTTLELLLRDQGAIYRHVEALGRQMDEGLNDCLKDAGIDGVVARQGSAFVLYFMDHEPRDWHDLASNHDFEIDRRFRLAMIENGVYFFPIPVKQCSISAQHAAGDIQRTIEVSRLALQSAAAVRA